MPRKRSQSRVAGHLGRTPGLDAPVLSRLEQGRSKGRPGDSALRLLEQREGGGAPRAPASPTAGAAAAGGAAPFADPMDRLMSEREARLSELRKKLHLWEENLKLAQLDQDRMRHELDGRMAEVNAVKKQWESTRESLKAQGDHGEVRD